MTNCGLVLDTGQMMIFGGRGAASEPFRDRDKERWGLVVSEEYSKEE